MFFHDLTESYRLEVHHDDTTGHIEHTIWTGGPKPYIQRWHPIRELGRGGFGTVRSEREVESGRVRAVKVIQKRLLPRGMDWKREIGVMATLVKFPHAFVEFEGWFETPEYVAIAMELIETGDLAAYLSGGRTLMEDEARKITFQVLGALELMHRHGIVHRDLKPANIFIASTHPKLHIKLGDFGISKRTQRADGASTDLRTLCYTIPYAAPELIRQETTHTSAVDLWALGCVVYEMVMGHTPFSNPLVLMEYCIGRVNPLVGEKGFSDELMAFMARLLDPDGGRRISAREAMEMPWIVTAVEEERKLTNGSDMLKQQCEAMKDKLESVQEKMEQVTEERDRLRGAVEELELNELRKMMKKLAGCQSAMSATFETMQQNAMNPIRNIR